LTPAANREGLSSAGSQLESLARLMNAAEISSFFYRPHQRRTYENWAAASHNRSTVSTAAGGEEAYRRQDDLRPLT
jgi:hypothetical protein